MLALPPTCFSTTSRDYSSFICDFLSTSSTFAFNPEKVKARATDRHTLRSCILNGMAKKPIVVSPREDGTWQAKTGGASKPMKITNTQKAAIERGKVAAKAQGKELIIQGEDGKIRSKDSYGRDPKSPKDKEH